MSREYAAIAHSVGKVLKQKLKRPESEPLPDELAELARKLKKVPLHRVERGKEARPGWHGSG